MTFESHLGRSGTVPVLEMWTVCLCVWRLGGVSHEVRCAMQLDRITRKSQGEHISSCLMQMYQTRCAHQ